MNELDRLSWVLWKQRDLVEMIIEVKKCEAENRPFRTIGDVPEDMTPQDLIHFQRERYSILEQVKLCNEDKIRSWLEDARKRVNEDGILDRFTMFAEIDLLEKCLGD